MITIQYSRYQQHGGFKMWSRGFGPSTTPLREVKSELLLQIERDLLRLFERSSSPYRFLTSRSLTTPAGTFKERG